MYKHVKDDEQGKQTTKTCRDRKKSRETAKYAATNKTNRKIKEGNCKNNLKMQKDSERRRGVQQEDKRNMARKVSTKQSEEKPATVGQELQPGRPQRLKRPELEEPFIRHRSKLLEQAKDKMLRAR